MARPALLLALAGVIFLCAATSTLAAPPPPGAPRDPCSKLLGCSECEPMSEIQVEEVRTAHKKRITEMKAKVAAKGADNTMKAEWKAARIAMLEAKLESDWPKGNRTLYACVKCSSTFELEAGRCACKAGTGVTFSRPADGSAPPKPASLECKACVGDTVSDPDAPQPKWDRNSKPDFGGRRGGKKGGEGYKMRGMGAKKSAEGGDAKDTGRRLLGADGRGGRGGPGRWQEWRASMCMPCPAGTKSNDEHTKCEP
ncbi:MAG: hypothetical protein J3K34DRAFT_399215 [Monoraphidium minutum]|nr:MAG: hypothetical protein J3K34DRAFT_399215 [Monoraphidium minutum]